jgi:hypothetical protein
MIGDDIGPFGREALEQRLTFAFVQLPADDRHRSTAGFDVHRRSRIGNRRLAARAIVGRRILAPLARIAADHRLIARRGSCRAMTAPRFVLLEGRIPKVVIGLSIAAITSHRMLLSASRFPSVEYLWPPRNA